MDQKCSNTELERQQTKSTLMKTNPIIEFWEGKPEKAQTNLQGQPVQSGGRVILEVLKFGIQEVNRGQIFKR